MNSRAPEIGTRLEDKRVTSPSNGAAPEVRSLSTATERVAVPAGQKNHGAGSVNLRAREVSRAPEKISGDQNQASLLAVDIFRTSSVLAAQSRLFSGNCGGYCATRGNIAAAGALVKRFWQSVKGFFNDQLLRSELGIFSAVKSTEIQRQKNHSQKNFPRAVKFSLQENESSYKFIGDNPKAKRFVETGVLLLFQETT